MIDNILDTMNALTTVASKMGPFKDNCPEFYQVWKYAIEARILLKNGMANIDKKKEALKEPPLEGGKLVKVN